MQHQRIDNKSVLLYTIFSFNKTELKMLSQSVLDKMSPQELVSKIRSLTYSIDNVVEIDPNDALDYINTLVLVAQDLQERVESYCETFNEE